MDANKSRINVFLMVPTAELLKDMVGYACCPEHKTNKIKYLIVLMSRQVSHLLYKECWFCTVSSLKSGKTKHQAEQTGWKCAEVLNPNPDSCPDRPKKLDWTGYLNSDRCDVITQPDLCFFYPAWIVDVISFDC